MGIPYIIVYLNKVDLRVSADMKELVELEIRELLEAYIIRMIYLLLKVQLDLL